MWSTVGNPGISEPVGLNRCGRILQVRGLFWITFKYTLCNSCDSRKWNTYCKHCMLTMCHAVKIFKNKPIQNFKWEEMGGGVGGGTWCARPGSTSVALGGWMFDVLTCLMINIWIHLLYTFIKLISLMSIPDLYAKK